MLGHGPDRLLWGTLRSCHSATRTRATLAAQRGSHSSAGPHGQMIPRLNSDAHAVSPAQLYRALSYCVYGIDATARAGACCAHVLSYVRTALASLIASRVGF